MTPEVWRQLEELYHAARALPPSQRIALLDRADPEVRAAVVAILAREGASEKDGTSQEDDGAFLDRPAWEGREDLLKAETPVAAGQQLGPYRIEQKIGQGGMGEVFRAIDPRLQRTVAIKTSLVQFTERFEREARVIAALNHPHIATLYDVGSSPSGLGYLVLEYVEGPTLADLIAKGPVNPREARRIALETAEAIEAAHEKGIVHRDLKPANIKLGEGGTVKVLDFGLAKAMNGVQPVSPGEITKTGTIVGTASYMSPEQALGGQIDRRSDIWSFGVLFLEMLSGKRPFTGATTSDVLASVVSGEPDFSDVPEEWTALIRRCLTKDIRRRLQSIGEARVMLEDGPPILALQPVSPRARQRWLLITTALVLLVGLGSIGGMMLWGPAAAPVAALNASLLPPSGTSFRFARNGEGGFALSPDGTKLAFVGRTEGKAQLWVRSLGESESRLLPGSEGAFYPFWSPDSRWIAFFTPQKLKKIEVATGAVIDLRDNSGNSMSEGVGVPGVSSYGETQAHLARCLYRACRMPVDRQCRCRERRADGSPQFLPDGRRFVYAIGGSLGRGRDLWLASLDPREKPRRIGEASEEPTYSERPTYSAGHILSVVNGTLTARPFDAARGEFTGESFPLKAPLARRVFLGYLLTDFSANTQGMLVYPPQTNLISELRWRDRTGKQLARSGRSRRILHATDFARRQASGVYAQGRRQLGHLGGEPAWKFVHAPHLRSGHRGKSGMVARWRGCDVCRMMRPDVRTCTAKRPPAPEQSRGSRTTTRSNRSHSTGPAMGVSCSIRKSRRSSEIMVLDARRRPAAELPRACARSIQSPVQSGSARAGSHTTSTTAAGARFTFRRSSPASPRPQRAGRFPMPEG